MRWWPWRTQRSPEAPAPVRAPDPQWHRIRPLAPVISRIPTSARFGSFTAGLCVAADPSVTGSLSPTVDLARPLSRLFAGEPPPRQRPGPVTPTPRTQTFVQRHSGAAILGSAPPDITTDPGPPTGPGASDRPMMTVAPTPEPRRRLPVSRATAIDPDASATAPAPVDVPDTVDAPQVQMDPMDPEPSAPSDGSGTDTLTESAAATPEPAPRPPAPSPSAPEVPPSTPDTSRGALDTPTPVRPIPGLRGWAPPVATPSAPSVQTATAARTARGPARPATAAQRAPEPGPPSTSPQTAPEPGPPVTAHHSELRPMPHAPTPRPTGSERARPTAAGSPSTGTPPTGAALPPAPSNHEIGTPTHPGTNAPVPLQRVQQQSADPIEVRANRANHSAPAQRLPDDSTGTVDGADSPTARPAPPAPTPLVAAFRLPAHAEAPVANEVGPPHRDDRVGQDSSSPPRPAASTARSDGSNSRADTTGYADPAGMPSAPTVSRSPAGPPSTAITSRGPVPTPPTPGAPTPSRNTVDRTVPLQRSAVRDRSQPQPEVGPASAAEPATRPTQAPTDAARTTTPHDSDPTPALLRTAALRTAAPAPPDTTVQAARVARFSPPPEPEAPSPGAPSGPAAPTGQRSGIPIRVARTAAPDQLPRPTATAPESTRATGEPVSFTQMFAAMTGSGVADGPGRPAATPTPLPIQRVPLPHDTHTTARSPEHISREAVTAEPTPTPRSAQPNLSRPPLPADPPRPATSTPAPLQRIEEPDTPPEATPPQAEGPPVVAATPAPNPTPVAGAAPTAGSGPSLDELARQLYEPLAARLRAELWLDRERSGLLTDR
ncbi:hypothetical protein DEU38_12315 [Rhodococcus sp. AG1013]|nr:hypothetical protein DEU38_12315 [Rhodococcus sp. AG1013]